MKDGVDPAEIGAVLELVAKRGAIEVVGDLDRREIGEFMPVGQVVDDQDVADAGRFRALTRFAPMKPAPPVTMYMNPGPFRR